MNQPNESAMQAVPHHVGALSTEASRSIEEVRASLTIAQQFPRDVERAMKRIEAECSQLRLAESGEYSYPRHDGGKRVEVTGASIRLLEVFMRHWGNLDAGWRELARWTDPKTGFEVVECEAYAWDMESNGRDRRRFSVLLARFYQNGGSKPITDPRDQYELIANYAQRRKRACLEAMVPQWAIDQARDMCKATLQEKIQISADTIEGLVAAFARFGVTKAQIEGYLEHPLTVAELTRREIIKLRGVHQALKDGEAKPRDFFPESAAESAGGPDEDLTEQFTEHANGGGESPEAEAEGNEDPDQGEAGSESGPPSEAELFAQVDEITAHPGKYSMDAINELAALTDAISKARREEYRHKLGEARQTLFEHQRGGGGKKAEQPQQSDDGVQGAFFGE